MSTTETPGRSTWLPDRRSASKPKKKSVPNYVSYLTCAAVAVALVVGGLVVATRSNGSSEERQARTSLVDNTKGLFGVHVTVEEVRFQPRTEVQEADFSIFDSDCRYTADITQAKNKEWTLVQGTEVLIAAKVTIKSDSAEAAACPAKPISDDLDRLANGG